MSPAPACRGGAQNPWVGNSYRLSGRFGCNAAHCDLPGSDL